MMEAGLLLITHFRRFTESWNNKPVCVYGIESGKSFHVHSETEKGGITFRERKRENAISYSGLYVC